MMRSRRVCLSSLLLLGLSGLFPGGQRSARAQSAFTAPDNAYTFPLPEGWKAAQSGDKVRIIGADGAAYLLLRDTLSSLPASNLMNDSAARAAAENIARGLLGTTSYAGVKILNVGSGNGAIFRFRGKGQVSEIDLAEIYVASIGRHSVVLMPEKAPSPDHAYELGTIFADLAFADTPKGAGAKRNAAPPTKSTAGTASSSTGSPQTGTASTTLTASSTSKTDNSAKELELYEGHMYEGDLGFSLSLKHNNTATMNWTSTAEMIGQFKGTYTGHDGNYNITLTQTSGSNRFRATGLTITLTAMGGMVKGNYVLASGTTRRDIFDIKLTSVDAPHMKLHGSRPGANNNRTMTKGRRRF